MKRPSSHTKAGKEFYRNLATREGISPQVLIAIADLCEGSSEDDFDDIWRNLRFDIQVARQSGFLSDTIDDRQVFEQGWFSALKSLKDLSDPENSEKEEPTSAWIIFPPRPKKADKRSFLPEPLGHPQCEGRGLSLEEGEHIVRQEIDGKMVDSVFTSNLEPGD